MIDFIFYFLLVGIIIASFQDLKRREIDNWLNWLILAGSFSFVLFEAISSSDYGKMWVAVACVIVMTIIANIFYYGRVFAGGDAKLLIALSVLFASSSWKSSLYNIGFFIFFLLLAGSIYGIIFALFLFFNNYKKTRKQFSIEINKVYLKWFFIAAILFLLAGFYDKIFPMFSIIILLFPILFAFAKSIEKIAMTRMVNAKELTEGDWIMQTIRVKGKIIKADWEGLTKKQLGLLKNYKKKVKIREGIPFAPVFLIAFILYYMRYYFLSLFV